MEHPQDAEDMDCQYAVIAKPVGIYEASVYYMKIQITESLMHRLAIQMNTSYIDYRAPNLIIKLYDPHLQKQALVDSTLQTERFIFQLAPWSKENELSEIPWIPGSSFDVQKIVINPMQILPLVATTKTAKGSKKLKDNYANMLGPIYEHRAPDYSYLMITELRDFYYDKFRQFRLMNHKSMEILQLLQHCLQCFYAHVSDIQAEIRKLTVTGKDDRYKDLCMFSDHLQLAVAQNRIKSDIIKRHISLLQMQPDEPINLDSLTDMHPLDQVRVLPKFNTRLQVIYAAATEQIYKTKSVITIKETAHNEFEASATVAESTYKFKKIPCNDATSMETVVIYQSLKSITNRFGYQIIDHNYPLLSDLITSINGLTLHLAEQQCCINYTMSDMSTINEGVCHFFCEYEMISYDLNNISVLNDKMESFKKSMSELYKAADELSDQFIDLKKTFHSIRFATQSTANLFGHIVQSDLPSYVLRSIGRYFG